MKLDDISQLFDDHFTCDKFTFLTTDEKIKVSSNPKT